MTRLKKEYRDILGRNIKKFRLDVGYSREYFAEVMDVSSRTVSYWEDGIYSPTLEKFVWICSELGRNPDELLLR